MVKVIEVKIPSEPRFLKIIRATIGHICETMGFATDESNNITLAVDEACSNIIKHAYAGAADQPIRMICSLHNDRLEILLKDSGKTVSAEAIKSRQLDDVRPGGLGVHLIKSVMDIVKYEHQPGQGNQLQLVKFLQRKE